MGLRDRFFTAGTAKAIMSWRLPVSLAAGVIAFLFGIPVLGAVAIAVAALVGSVARAMPKGLPGPARIDPFTVGEPWRQLVQGAQRSRQRLAATVATAPAGPLRSRLDDIVAKLDAGLAEGWATARRGDEIDAAVSRLDPTALRSRLGSLRQRAAAAPSDDLTAAITSVESQLATADRLKALSATTADRMRLTQTRLDELVARAAEVTIGTGATDELAKDVDDLVIELEALHQAIGELDPTSTPGTEPLPRGATPGRTE